MPVAWVVGGEGPTTRGRAGVGHSKKGRGQMGGDPEARGRALQTRGTADLHWLGGGPW